MNSNNWKELTHCANAIKQSSHNTLPPECISTGDVKSTKIKALVDSGATHCMVGDKFFAKLPGLRRNLVKLRNPIKAVAINGTTVTYKSKLTFSITFHKQTYTLTALYSPSISYEIVLGLDFLRNNDIHFNFRANDITTNRRSRVKLTSDITLPANTESAI